MEKEKLPFKQVSIGNTKLRLFSENVDDSELKWHQDDEDRIVTILHETNWMFQFDNKLPEPLTPDKKIFIPKGEWHRLIKGDGDLEISVELL